MIATFIFPLAGCSISIKLSLPFRLSTPCAYGRYNASSQLSWGIIVFQYRVPFYEKQGLCSRMPNGRIDTGLVACYESSKIKGLTAYGRDCFFALIAGEKTLFFFQRDGQESRKAGTT